MAASTSKIVRDQVSLVFILVLTFFILSAELLRTSIRSGIEVGRGCKVECSCPACHRSTAYVCTGIRVRLKSSFVGGPAIKPGQAQVFRQWQRRHSLARGPGRECFAGKAGYEFSSSRCRADLPVGIPAGSMSRIRVAVVAFLAASLAAFALL